MELRKRISRVIESILENERLTAGLEDEAAQQLLTWGISCTQTIMQSTTDLDDEAAEAVTAPRLRATRRLMREANRWVGHRIEGDEAAATQSLDKIIVQAAIIYEDQLSLPDNEQKLNFSRASLQRQTQKQMIVALREFIENIPSPL